MNLSFSTKYPKHMGELGGKPNYFVEKIWAGLLINEEKLDIDSNRCLEYIYACERIGINVSNENFVDFPKLHTIRHDPHHRWKPGMKIHPVINNRTKNRFQFAPTLVCTGVQEIIVTHYRDSRYHYAQINIDGKVLEVFETEKLALNDGFPSVQAFFDWFNEDFEGVIIHWTELRY